MKKLIILAVLLVVFFTITFYVNAEGVYTVYLGNKDLKITPYHDLKSNTFYLPLNEIETAFHLKTAYDEKTKTLTINNKATDFKVFSFNNRHYITLNGLCDFQGYGWAVSDVRKIIVIARKVTSLQGKKIWVDAGHGGKDSGAIGFSGKLEKNVNLSIALKLKKKLTNLKAKVYMTREKDDTVENICRACRANRNKDKIDIFISIHANALKDRTNTGFKGTLVLYHIEATDKDKLLAALCLKHLIKKLGTENRGIKQHTKDDKTVTVLEKPTMPTVLNEIAFISNQEEEKKLTDPIFQEKTAQAIAEAVKEYFFILESGVPLKYFLDKK